MYRRRSAKSPGRSRPRPGVALSCRKRARRYGTVIAAPHLEISAGTAACMLPHSHRPPGVAHSDMTHSDTRPSPVFAKAAPRQVRHAGSRAADDFSAASFVPARRHTPRDGRPTTSPASSALSPSPPLPTAAPSCSQLHQRHLHHLRTYSRTSYLPTFPSPGTSPRSLCVRSLLLLRPSFFTAESHVRVMEHRKHAVHAHFFLRSFLQQSPALYSLLIVLQVCPSVLPLKGYWSGFPMLAAQHSFFLKSFLILVHALGNW